MTPELKYHEAPRELLERRDAIVAFMDRHMPEPIAVMPMAAYDVLTGESLGTEGCYAVSKDPFRSGGGPMWSLADYHNFKKYGLIVDDGMEFEDSLWQIARMVGEADGR